MLFLRLRRCYNCRNTAAIVQWQNAALWQRMSWGRKPLAPPNISDPVTFRPTLPRVSQVSLSASAKRLYAGTSGWAYPTWKPEFYPAGTPAKRFLEFYASKLTSVEVNY